MASTNKTSLGLNRWEASDKPVRQDFVNDNEIIDGKITQLNRDLAKVYDRGVAIPSGANLNTFLTAGNFYSFDAVNTSTLLNVPADVATGFRMDIKTISASGWVKQFLYPNVELQRVYVRARDANTNLWGTWFVFRGEAV